MSSPDLASFASRYNRILIKRRLGGVGDVLAHRMIFQDLKIAAPGAHVTFAVPNHLMPLAWDHPFIDEVVAAESVRDEDYAFVADTTDKCAEYEYPLIPHVDKHRSDIWAQSFGLHLNHHEMFIRITEEERSLAAQIFEEDGHDGPRVAIAPRTASAHKDMDDQKWQAIIDGLEERGCAVYSFHDSTTDFHGCANVHKLPLRTWMAAVEQCHYTITLATALFHLANGLHKPTVAIFGCEDLQVFGRYFPEMIPVQRREGEGGWARAECPCWRNECQYLERGVGNGGDPSLCMQSITPNEVLAAFDELMQRPEGEYYDERYFTLGGCKGWYDQSAFAKDNQFHKARATDVVEVLPLAPKSSVLDVGTARGNLPMWLTEFGMEGFGTDVSRWAVRKSHLDPDHVQWSDMRQEGERPFGGKQFHAITSREVLEHIDDEHVDAFLSNLFELTVPGGYSMHWIATDRNAKEQKKQADAKNYDQSHVCIVGPDWWVDRFEKAGFELSANLTVKAMHRPDAVRYDWDCIVMRRPT